MFGKDADDSEIMSQKAHGTCNQAVQDNLRWGVDQSKADKICCFNRHYAERSGYAFGTNWFTEMEQYETVTYYDSVTGLPLFTAPQGRSMAEFLEESRKHGWPSFRDNEVNWDNAVVLSDGETVSNDGTHLGHNIPDYKGNRYCINLVSVSGNKI